MMVEGWLLVPSDPPYGAAPTPVTSRSAPQSNITSPRMPRGPEPKPAPASQLFSMSLPTALVMKTPPRSVCVNVLCGSLDQE